MIKIEKFVYFTEFTYKHTYIFIEEKNSTDIIKAQVTYIEQYLEFDTFETLNDEMRKHENIIVTVVSEKFVEVTYVEKS